MDGPEPLYVPPELCEIIANHAHPNDLYSLARVSRNWAFFAIPRLWKSRILNLDGPQEQEYDAAVYHNEADEDIGENMDLHFYIGGMKRERPYSLPVLRTGRTPPSIIRVLKGLSGSSPRKSRSYASSKITRDTPLLFDYPSLLTKLSVRYRRVSDFLPLLKAHGHQLRFLDLRGIVYENREAVVAGSPESPFSYLSSTLEYLDVSRAWVLKASGSKAKGKKKNSDDLAQSLRRAGWVDLYASCLKTLGSLPAPPETDPEAGTLETRRREGTPGLKVLCLGNSIDDTPKLKMVLEAVSTELKGLAVDGLALNAMRGLAGAAMRETAGIESCQKLQWLIIENPDPKVEILNKLFRTVRGKNPGPSCPELRSLMFTNANLSILRWLSNKPYENSPRGIKTIHVTGDLARLGSEPEIDGTLLSAFPNLAQFGLECANRAVLHSEDFREAIRSSILQCTEMESFSLIGLGTNKPLTDKDVDYILNGTQSNRLKTLLLPFADRFYVSNRVNFGRKCFMLASDWWGDSLEKLTFGVPSADDPAGPMSLQQLAVGISWFKKLRDVELWGLPKSDFLELRSLFQPASEQPLRYSRDYWAWQTSFELKRGISGSRWADSELPTCVRLGTRAAVMEFCRMYS